MRGRKRRNDHIGIGVRLNEFVAVLVPDFQNFVAHQVSVEDCDLVGGQAVKKDLRIVNLLCLD